LSILYESNKSNWCRKTTFWQLWRLIAFKGSTGLIGLWNLKMHLKWIISNKSQVDFIKIMIFKKLYLLKILSKNKGVWF
jgi:hypothetical protein